MNKSSDNRSGPDLHRAGNSDVVDNSRSSLSREYLRKVDSSPEVKIVSYCADMEEAKLMLKDRLAYGIIYIPAEFSEDIARGKQTQVSLYCDMSGLLYYKSLLNTNTSVSLDMNADIKMQRAGNTTNRQETPERNNKGTDVKTNINMQVSRLRMAIEAVMAKKIHAAR